MDPDEPTQSIPEASHPYIGAVAARIEHEARERLKVKQRVDAALSEKHENTERIKDRLAEQETVARTLMSEKSLGYAESEGPRVRDYRGVPPTYPTPVGLEAAPLHQQIAGSAMLVSELSEQLVLAREAFSSATLHLRLTTQAYQDACERLMVQTRTHASVPDLTEDL